MRLPDAPKVPIDNCTLKTLVQHAMLRLRDRWNLVSQFAIVDNDVPNPFVPLTVNWNDGIVGPIRLLDDLAHSAWPSPYTFPPILRGAITSLAQVEIQFPALADAFAEYMRWKACDWPPSTL